MMKLRIEKRSNEAIPSWYGIAWRRWDRDVSVCYVLPLNWIVRLARAFWISLKCPRPWQTEMLESYKHLWGLEKIRAEAAEKKAAEYEEKALWCDYYRDQQKAHSR